MIRLASSLRIGDAQKRVVAQARDCIRTQNFQNMQSIFEQGGQGKKEWAKYFHGQRKRIAQY